MTIDKIAGIIGWPVSHSLSPLMHNAAFLELGLSSWVYIPMPVPKTPSFRIKEAILGLRALGFKGANVTVPYKEMVLPYMDYMSDSARSIGAVNTIVIDRADLLCGHNTDGLGFVNDLRERHIHTAAMDVLLLGAGGSARALAHALLEHGCNS
ncbi:MAG TPA: shikimate dehydrogenase, partial [Myxococcota bacterium]|nr:shikimate dehydrogenase [Myxococcota bacterium]